MKQLSPLEYDFLFDSSLDDAMSWYNKIMENNPNDSENYESPAVYEFYLNNPLATDGKKKFWLFWQRKVLSSAEIKKNKLRRKY